MLSPCPAAGLLGVSSKLASIGCPPNGFIIEGTFGKYICGGPIAGATLPAWKFWMARTRSTRSPRFGSCITVGSGVGGGCVDVVAIPTPFPPEGGNGDLAVTGWCHVGMLGVGRCALRRATSVLVFFCGDDKSRGLPSVDSDVLEASCRVELSSPLAGDASVIIGVLLSGTCRLVDLVLLLVLAWSGCLPYAWSSAMLVGVTQLVGPVFLLLAPTS